MLPRPSGCNGSDSEYCAPAAIQSTSHAVPHTLVKKPPHHKPLPLAALVAFALMLLGAPAAMAHTGVDITPPKLTTFVKAAYPADAQKAGREAVVELWITVAADGGVSEVAVKKGANAAFDAAAVAAAQRFKFRPAKNAKGVPIPVRIRFSYHFKIAPTPPAKTPKPRVTLRHGTLTGAVVDDDSGVPLPGQHVRLEPDGWTVHTDENGRFAFKTVPAGDHSVVVRPTQQHAGARAMVAVGAGLMANVDIRVGAVAAQGHTTVVRGKRFSAPTASGQVIGQRALKMASKRSASDLMRLVGGISVVQHGTEGKSYQFFVRGFDAAHGSDVEVTVDDVPVGELSNVHANGYLDMDFILPELVQRLEVTKGPFSLDQGIFATAATVRYRLGVAEDERGFRMSYTLGTTMRHRVFLGWASEDGQHIFGAEAVQDAGYGARRRHRRASAMARVTLFDDADAGRLELMASAYAADFELPGLLVKDDIDSGRIGRFDSYGDADYGISGRGLVSLRYAGEVAGQPIRARLYAGVRRLELRENFTGALIDPVRGDAFLQQQWTGTVGFAARYEPLIGDPDLKLRLVAELGLHSDHIDQTQHAVARKVSLVAAERDLVGWQHLAHGALGIRWEPLEWLEVWAGLRLTMAGYDAQDRLTGEDGAALLWDVSPRVVVAFRPLDTLRISASYGRGVRAPEIRAVVDGTGGQVPDGDEQLDRYRGGPPSMTVADSVELGAVWSPARWLRVGVAGFGTFIERESLFDHVSGVNLERNATRRLGVEVSLTLRPVEWLELRGDLTWVDARFVQSGDKVPGVPALVGQAQLSLIHPEGLRFGFQFLGLGARPLMHGAQGSGFATASLSFAYERDWFEIGFVVDNLFDARFNEGEYHYASQWNPHAPTSYLPRTHVVPGAPWNLRATAAIRY